MSLALASLVFLSFFSAACRRPRADPISHTPCYTCTPWGVSYRASTKTSSAWPCPVPRLFSSLSPSPPLVLSEQHARAHMATRTNPSPRQGRARQLLSVHRETKRERERWQGEKLRDVREKWEGWGNESKTRGWGGEREE